MKIQHILFDLDGTLTDSMPGIAKAVQYALRHYGIEVSDLETLRPFVGPPLTDSFAEYYGFSPEKAQEAVYVFREYYNVSGWKDNAPFPGVREMLEKLKEGGKTLYVATSKPEATAKRVLEYFSLTGYFAFIAGSLEESDKKADVIRRVLRENGLAPGPDSLMIGDRRHDIEGAHEAGLSAAGVLHGYGSREELLTAGADLIFRDPWETAERLLTNPM